MYPPIVIIPGGKYPGQEWEPSKIEKQKDEEASKLLQKSRELCDVLVLYN